MILIHSLSFNSLRSFDSRNFDCNCRHRSALACTRTLRMRLLERGLKMLYARSMRAQLKCFARALQECISEGQPMRLIVIADAMAGSRISTEAWAPWPTR